LIAYPVFRQAGFVHALTSREARTLGSYFHGKKSVIIPPGIDLQSTGKILADLPPIDLHKAPYFLFLGRLHPVKGIQNLIKAFARMSDTRFKLVIAGPSQQKELAYAESLHNLVSELGIGQRVVFPGAVSGSNKWQLYREAWAFCLPSFSEGFPLVNLEAAAAGTPIITTFGTGDVDDWDHNGGIMIQPSEQSLSSALEQAAGWSWETRLNRGNAIHSFVERNYSWEYIGKKWFETYFQLMDGEANGR
jgi:glycosyltransferase involved in cell wall biosynthesis